MLPIHVTKIVTYLCWIAINVFSEVKVENIERFVFLRNKTNYAFS